MFMAVVLEFEFEFVAPVDLLPLLVVVSKFLSSDDIVEMVVENVDLGHLDGNDAEEMLAQSTAGRWENVVDRYWL